MSSKEEFLVDVLQNFIKTWPISIKKKEQIHCHLFLKNLKSIEILLTINVS